MKISKKWLKRIIKEEKAKLLKEQTPADLGAAAVGADRAGRELLRGRAAPAKHGLFDAQYITDLITAEIDDYLMDENRTSLTPEEAKAIDRVLRQAADVIYDFVD